VLGLGVRESLILRLDSHDLISEIEVLRVAMIERISMASKSSERWCSQRIYGIHVIRAFNCVQPERVRVTVFHYVCKGEKLTKKSLRS